MSTAIDDLLDRMQALRDELEAEFQKKREEIEFVIEDRRVRFARHVLATQHLYHVGLLRYVRGSRWSVVVTAPVVYSGFVAFALMDLFVTVYQSVCFPIYGIPKVSRSACMVFDRADLPYLNAIERFNCFYCSYGNGVAAYLREVASRTEQYWCPIKHARRLLDSHDRYARFFEFGDAPAYREGLARLRRQFPPGP